MVGDGTWLAIGEVIDLYRKAGYPDSETTIRREIDTAAKDGRVEVYRTGGGKRRIKATDVANLIAAKRSAPPSS